MKHTLALAVMLTAACSLPAYANISLTLPKSAQLLVVNGVVMEDKTSLDLNDGNNQIVFKYNTSFWQQGQQRRFASEAVVLTFSGTNQEYSLSLPKLRSSAQADRFNKQPQIILEDDNGKSVDHNSHVLLKVGLQLGRDYAQEVASYNQTGAIAALTALVPTADITSLPAPQTTSVATAAILNSASANTTNNIKIHKDQINVGQMLDFWYSQADEETRKAFKDRIKQN
ncbi:DUF2057 domain-containing protein [Shewanella violacea]|uniref:UPF0319 protein SVI_1731 n=1 Tax=Shewanella violacea (strain JCM 10179 / CIP 106290 / LMG 19151 / DSS12) TaxID=637905 RepID=D4ZJ53_SHEVD|nr:DUF2057 domain-containing protein [Shewanella violacea]BAJ01702.1 conserved hypothetical protein [Shewanella violacea DSS12]